MVSRSRRSTPRARQAWTAPKPSSSTAGTGSLGWGEHLDELGAVVEQFAELGVENLRVAQDPALVIYFTYSEGQITLRAVDEDLDP